MAALRSSLVVESAAPLLLRKVRRKKENEK